MNLGRSIRRVLREEGYIPSPIRRRVSSEDIEEAFEFALEQNAVSMNNPRSIIFKDKEHTTLWLFAKFVIDDMVTHIEQESFNDDNRVYFSDNEEDAKNYHEKIRQPLLRHYGKRIKEIYYQIKPKNVNESTSGVEKLDNLKGKHSNNLKKLTIDFIGEDNVCNLQVLYSHNTYVIDIIYNGVSTYTLPKKLEKFLRSIIPVNLFAIVTDTIDCNPTNNLR